MLPDRAIPPPAKPARRVNAKKPIIQVLPSPLNRCQAWVTVGSRRFRAALGRSGIVASKREGDGATPTGTFDLVAVYYRADRGHPPVTALPRLQIQADHGWCDDLASANYNRPIRLPSAAGHERLFRSDQLYDIVIVLDHNLKPRKRGGGSAIFMHVARPGYLPTEGCIALSAADLRQLLKLAGRGSHIKI